MLWCFLGKIGDNERQKPKIFLKCGCKVDAGCGSACLPFDVSVGAGVRLFRCYFANVSKIVLMLLLFGVLLAFSRFTLGALLANVALFGVLRAFLEGFSCPVWVCLAWVLCVACGAFVRVWS